MFGKYLYEAEEILVADAGSRPESNASKNRKLIAAEDRPSPRN